MAGDDDAREEWLAWFAAEFGRPSPLVGLTRLTELRATLDRIEALLVLQARRRWFFTWEEIGGALGVSRQAAQRRHPAATRRPRRPRREPPWGREPP